MGAGKSAHSTTNLGNDGHRASLNGKPQHTHIPRIYNGIDKTFNSFPIPGGGVLECAICGEILTDSQT